MREVIIIQLLEESVSTHEMSKWKDSKEESFHRERRDQKKKEKQAKGESVSESDDWEDSDSEAAVSPNFDPLLFLAQKLREFKSNYV